MLWQKSLLALLLLGLSQLANAQQHVIYHLNEGAPLQQFRPYADGTQAPLLAGQHKLFGKADVAEQPMYGQSLQDIVDWAEAVGFPLSLREQSC